MRREGGGINIHKFKFAYIKTTNRKKAKRTIRRNRIETRNNNEQTNATPGKHL